MVVSHVPLLIFSPHSLRCSQAVRVFEFLLTSTKANDRSKVLRRVKAGLTNISNKITLNERTSAGQKARMCRVHETRTTDTLNLLKVLSVTNSRQQDLKGMRNEHGEIIIEHKFDMVNSTTMDYAPRRPSMARCALPPPLPTILPLSSLLRLPLSYNFLIRSPGQPLHPAQLPPWTTSLHL